MKKVECQWCGCAVNEGETTCQRCLKYMDNQYKAIYKDTGKVPCVSGEEMFSILERN